MSERGDASVEFVGVLVAVVIPLLYVALALGQVSAGAMAVDAGAREAATSLLRMLSVRGMLSARCL